MSYVPPPPPQPYLPNVSWAVAPVVPTRTDLQAVATDPSDQQAQCTAENGVLRVIYGRTRIGAQVADVLVYQNCLVVLAVWGQGEIDAIESATANDKVLPGTVTATHYTGTAGQTVNSLLVSAYAAIGVTYTDALPGIAYSVFKVPVGAVDGFPEFAAIIRGRKVYDPRTATTAYSNNPALCLADFIVSTTYGLGLTVDWASVIVAADANDVLIGGEKRRIVGLALDTVQQSRQWCEALRTYAGCFIQYNEEDVVLIPDRPSASVATLTDTNIVARSMRVAKRGIQQVPTVVEILYTDTSKLPWSEKSAIVKAAGVDAGTTPRRESQISLPGIHRYSQAYREAVERLNKLTLSDLSCSFTAFDEALKIQSGDVITVTHSLGLSSKLMRVMDPVANSPGRWSLSAFEYDPGVYSDVVQAEPTYSDTTLPDPAAPPALTEFLVVEEVYQLDNGTWSSRFKITWDASDYVYLDRYFVEVYSGGDLIVTAPAREPIYRTGPVQEGVLYQCKVASVSSIGVVGAWSQYDITAQGKQLVPGDVPSINVLEVGGHVYVSWVPAIDVDIWRYEIRYVAAAGAWADGTVIDIIDSLRIDTVLIPVGTWDVMVKAIDSVGQESANETRKTVIVTADSSSFFVDQFDLTTPQWLNLVSYSNALDNAAWSKVYCSWSTGKLAETADTAAHYVDRLSITCVTNAKLTWAVKVKAAERSKLQLALFDSTTANYVYATYDLAAETATPGTPGGAGSATSATIRRLGDEYYRITLTGIPASSDSGSLYSARIQILNDAGATSYLGVSGYGLYVGECQLSQTDYPLEYGDTGASAITVGGYGMAKIVNPFSPSIVHYVTEDNVTFASKFSSSMSTYTDPLFESHASMTSDFIGESEDFGLSVSGQWTVTADVEALNGSLLSYLGLSADGSAWNWLEGLSQKSSGRYARIRHTAETTGTLYVSVPQQNIRLDVVPKEESFFGLVSLASGGKLVQLENNYSAVKRILITPEGSTAKIGMYDRVIIAPEDGLVLQNTCAGGGDSYVQHKIETSGYTFISGDYIEYDVFVADAPSTAVYGCGGLHIKFTTTDYSYSFTLNDALGDTLGNPRHLRGAWKSRKVSAASIIGKISSDWFLYRAGDIAGDYKAVYRNIRITDGAGTIRHQVWESGEPTVNTTTTQALSSNIVCGPANSFMAYIFNDAGSQVASNFSATFQGV